jgi:hypothetical protein
MNLLSRHFEDDIMRFFRYVLKANCLRLALPGLRKIYNVAMDLPLDLASPILDEHSR